MIHEQEVNSIDEGEASDYSELSYDADDLEELKPNSVNWSDILVKNYHGQTRNLFDNRLRLNFANR